jgi:hypothetical protein
LLEFKIGLTYSFTMDLGSVFHGGNDI